VLSPKLSPRTRTHNRSKHDYCTATPATSSNHNYRTNRTHLPPVLTSVAMEMIDRIFLLLFVAQMTVIVGDACLSMCLKFKRPMSISTLLYGFLASYILVTLGFYSPAYLAACLCNLLGNFLATVTGAPFPEVFYGNGYGYEDDAEAYCRYLLSESGAIARRSSPAASCPSWYRLSSSSLCAYGHGSSRDGVKGVN